MEEIQRRDAYNQGQLKTVIVQTHVDRQNALEKFPRECRRLEKEHQEAEKR